MQKNRYLRNIRVIGAEGQKKLFGGSVFVVGCGALGGQVSMLLAGAGVGRIGIADFDTVDISNLQRQLFFEEGNCGLSKAQLLSRRMQNLNSEITVDIYNELITPARAKQIFLSYDFIIDATDNPASKYSMDRVCLEVDRPLCIGGVAGWRGQVMSMKGNDENHTVRFSEVFPLEDGESPDSAMLPCEIEGVMGAAASAIASLQASEAIKYLTGDGEPLFNRLLMMDLGKPYFQIIDL